MDNTSIAGLSLSSPIPVFLGPVWLLEEPNRTAVRAVAAKLFDPHMPRPEMFGGVSKSTQGTETWNLIGDGST
jgi:hypothetical protein